MPSSPPLYSSAASDVYKRQKYRGSSNGPSPSVGRIGTIRSGRRDAVGANWSGSGSPVVRRVMDGLWAAGRASANAGTGGAGWHARGGRGASGRLASDQLPRRGLDLLGVR